MDANERMTRKPGAASRKRKAAGDAYMADAIDVMTERLTDASNHSRIDIGGAAAGGPAGAGPYASAVDFAGLPLKKDHDKRPFWVTPTGSIFLEATSPLYEQARDFLVAICEPVSRPEFLHEYRLDRNALFAAASMGLTSSLICSALERMSKVPVAQPVLDFVHACTTGYGKVKLVLQKGKYYLESSYPAILRLLNRHPVIRASRVVYLPDGTRRIGLDGKKKKKNQGAATGSNGLIGADNGAGGDDDDDDFEEGVGWGLLSDEEDDDDDAEDGDYQPGGAKAAKKKAAKAASSIRGMQASSENYGFEVATSLAEAEGSLGLKGILQSRDGNRDGATELSGLLRKATAGGDTAGGTLTRRVIGEIDSDEEQEVAAAEAMMKRMTGGAGGGAGGKKGASTDVAAAAMEAILGANKGGANSSNNISNNSASAAGSGDASSSSSAASLLLLQSAIEKRDGEAIFSALKPDLEKLDEAEVATLLEALNQAEITARAEERLIKATAGGVDGDNAAAGSSSSSSSLAGGAVGGTGPSASAASKGPVSLIDLYSTTTAISSKMAALAAFQHATGATSAHLYDSAAEAAAGAATKLSFRGDIGRQLMGLESSSSALISSSSSSSSSVGGGRSLANIGKDKDKNGGFLRRDKAGSTFFDPLAGEDGSNETAFPPPPPGGGLVEEGEQEQDSIALRRGKRSVALKNQAEKEETSAAVTKKAGGGAGKRVTFKNQQEEDAALAQEEEEFATAAASAAADQTDDAETPAAIKQEEEERAALRMAAQARSIIKEEARQTAEAAAAAAVAGKKEVEGLLKELDPMVVTATVIEPQGTRIKLKTGGDDTTTATTTATVTVAGVKRPRPEDEPPASSTTTSTAGTGATTAAGNAAKRPKYDDVILEDEGDLTKPSARAGVAGGGGADVEDDDANDEDYDASKDDDYKEDGDDSDEDYDEAEERKKKRKRKGGKGGAGAASRGKYVDGGLGFYSTGGGNKRLTKAEQEKQRQLAEAAEELKMQAASAEIFSHVASNEAASLAQFEVLYKRLHASTTLQSLHTPGRVERFEIDFSMVDSVKKVCLFLDPPLPLVQEYDFRGDTALPRLSIQLRDPSSLRPYQEKSLAKMFGNGRARSGIIVLPCGAGKTLVGISAATTIGKSTIILCPNQTSVQQWMEQLFRFTTVPAKNVCILTAKKKEQLPPLHEAVVLLTTYTMIGSGGRGEESRALLNAIAAREWGCMLLDEVHQAVANTFSKALRLRAHCRLGLTATLVREDGRDKRLSLFIGPKLYEANWMDLTRGGYLANVQCMEVWCPMTPAFYHEYLTAKSIAKRKALAVMNPVKCAAMDYLIKKHDKRGDKIIIFSESVFALRLYAEQYKVLAIEGATPPNHREAFIKAFKTPDSGVNKLFLSRVGDVALDVPDANVIIQISSHFGSRLQEAQRMGRILRRGTASNAISGQNAFFYTLVSTDTLEMYFANKRRRYLVDQGYAYKVLMADKLVPPPTQAELLAAQAAGGEGEGANAGGAGAAGSTGADKNKKQKEQQQQALSTAVVPAATRKPHSLGEANAIRLAAESEGLARLFAKASFMSTQEQQGKVLEAIAQQNVDEEEGKEDNMMAEEAFVNEDDLRAMQKDKDRASGLMSVGGGGGAGGGASALRVRDMRHADAGSVLPPTRSIRSSLVTNNVVPAATKTTVSGLDAFAGGGKALQYLEFQSDKSGFDALREAEEMAAAEQRAQREALLAARAAGKDKSKQGGGEGGSFNAADLHGMMY